ncbi:hypothetical protein ACLOJK_016030 [Asimina triloba]
MEKPSEVQESDSSSVGFAEVPGEPAIVINGVPKISPTDVVCTASNTSDSELEIDPCFGRYLEGRAVQKRFGENYFSGKVVKYDEESNWYRVVYEDEDFEDLDWNELQQVLVPLDIALPLKALLKMNKQEKLVSMTEENALGPRKTTAKNEPMMKPVEGSSETSIPKQFPPKRGRGRPRKEDMDATVGKQMGSPVKENADGDLGKRKRGRPRKQNAGGTEQKKRRERPIKQNTDGSYGTGGKRGRGRPRKFNVEGMKESHHTVGNAPGAVNQEGMDNIPDINLIDVEVGLVNDQGFQQRAEDGVPTLTA